MQFQSMCRRDVVGGAHTKTRDSKSFLCRMLIVDHWWTYIFLQELSRPPCEAGRHPTSPPNSRQKEIRGRFHRLSIVDGRKYLILVWWTYLCSKSSHVHRAKLYDIRRACRTAAQVAFRRREPNPRSLQSRNLLGGPGPI